MKARVVKEGNFWIGEVYGIWNVFFGSYEREGWGTVTPKCFTKLGAKFELMKWKREQFNKSTDGTYTALCSNRRFGTSICGYRSGRKSIKIRNRRGRWKIGGVAV